ncbi:DUF3990 domain-containing protein [Fibrobacter sp.]|uniref:DUF3990 domain-containing protein n=1 Tax=Fibrobacter sp. TaxID=35828 RepID=UPI0025BD21AA|nr:DUF3990 domain-containing protein [Fibrobacter sp.]MBR3072461.1 DUF3990 domain-containing protein [Fibrobacter sp.]
MILYHGSEKKIPVPEWGKGNPKNDYGLGFYCTESQDLAKEWACQKNVDGFANAYSLNTDGLRILDLSEDKFSLLHWLTILMQNRVFSTKSPIGKQNLQFLTERFQLDYEEYDIIRGYRANDSYFSFASDFLENIIPIQCLANSMKLGSLGLQTVLKSRKSFLQLTFEKAEKADKETYYIKYKERDSSARKSYFESLRHTQPSESIYLIDLVRNPELLNDISL